MSDKKAILFVDDEPNILQGLRRMLHSLRNEWNMEFVECGEEALAAMEKKSFDVIVSDMRMPGMDGASLLTEVKRRHPQVARIVLSGHSNKELILRAILPTHQYLSKPCSAEVLKSTVARTCALRTLLADKSLQALISGMSSLPSLPKHYTQLMNELDSSSTSIQKVAKVISGDIGMTTKMLQIVNSSFFGFARSVSDPAQAVTLLGLDTIKALALSIDLFSQGDKRKIPGISLELLWEHSMSVAALAKQIAVCENTSQEISNEAFTAGMLHDVGKIILAKNLPKKYAEVAAFVRNEGVTEVEAETEILGETHAAVGAALLSLWGLPDDLVEALAYHHFPSQCAEKVFLPLTAVHVANGLVHESCDTNESREASKIDPDYLASFGLDARLDVWRELLPDQTENGAR